MSTGYNRVKRESGGLVPVALAAFLGSMLGVAIPLLSAYLYIQDRVDRINGRIEQNIRSAPKGLGGPPPRLDFGGKSTHK